MPAESTPPPPSISPQGSREEAQSHLETLAKRLLTLPERGMRREIMGEYFAKLSLEVQVEFLHLLAMRSAAFSEYRTALVAFQDLSVATHGLHYEHSRELYEAARVRGYKHVQRLLLSTPAQRQDERPPRGHHHLAEVTLGERKSLARQQNIYMLEKLLLDPDPSVIRMLLQNPRITEKEVLLIATRRPNQPQILQEIARHARWFRRLSVQIALCKNPYTPVPVILQYLPSLPTPELKEIRDMAQVHPHVLEALAEILNIRDAARYYQSDRTPSPIQHAPPPDDPPTQNSKERLFSALERLRIKTDEEINEEAPQDPAPEEES